MKKIIIVLLIFLFANCLFSMPRQPCKCGEREKDLQYYLGNSAGYALIASVPVYMNYMLIADNNITFLVLYDLPIAVIAAGEAIFDDVQGRYIAYGLIAEFGYSFYSMIAGLMTSNGGQTARGIIGVTATPAAVVLGMLFFNPFSDCRPENDCALISPVVGYEYAGIDMSFRFQ